MSAGARHELHQRIAAQLRIHLADDEEFISEVADKVMSLFQHVDDYWDRVDVSLFSTDGQSFLEQRWLVARACVQAQPHDRVADRTVDGGIGAGQ